MTPSVALLVLISAVAHPLWNLLVKRAASPEGAMVGLGAVLAVLGGVHTAVSGAAFVPPPEAWPLLAASVIGQVVYGIALVQVLRAHDLSIGYPLVRAAPVAMLAVDVLVLGHAHGWSVFVGIAVMTLGGVLLQRQGPAGAGAGRGRTLVFALLAMAGTVTYSMVDGLLTRMIPPAVLLMWTQAAALPLFLAGFHLLRRPGLLDWLRRPGPVLAAGVLAYAAYWLVLRAFELGGSVPAVSALRQVSIPLAVLMGGLVLKEGRMARRLGAAGLMAIGAAAIVLVK